MKSLFDETKLKNVKLRNRCIRSATWEGMADERGHLTETHDTIYRELATGGIGLIITGMAGVLGPSTQMFGIYDDVFIDEYKTLTSSVHRHEAPIVMQLAYEGSQGGSKISGGKVWGLSAVRQRTTGITPKEMTTGDIKAVIDSFAEAAERAKKAGFDGVQLHAAHGYFLSQCLSPYYNRRTDEYGVTVQGRARILYEVCEQIRERVGEEYLVMAKVNCDDLFEGGLTLEDSIKVCQGLQERGVAAIEVSGGQAPERGAKHAIMRTKLEKPERQSYFCRQAARIAEEIDIPVVLVGGNRDPKLLNKIINTTPIEYISLSRPLIREPNLVHRWQSGNLAPARCISCNWCLENAARGEELACKFEKD